MSSLNNFSFDGCYSMHNLRSRAELPFLIRLLLVYVESVSLFFWGFFPRCTIQMKYQNAHEFGRDVKKNDDDDDFSCNHFILAKQGS